MTPTNPATSEIPQKPSHGRDPMDFRKEQKKEETAQELAQRADKDKVGDKPTKPSKNSVNKPLDSLWLPRTHVTSLLSLGKAHKDE